MATYREQIKKKLVNNINGISPVSKKVKAPQYVYSINTYVNAILSNTIFSNNNAGTRTIFMTYITAYMTTYIAGMGHIDDFIVICDSTNNVDYSDHFNVLIQLLDAVSSKWFTLSYTIYI